jgi:O6-methylguanine-DNA--protein-cysteine methyltransferase
VTAAIYGAGFNSNSRFYEKSDDVLGMKPTDYRAGGANTTIHFSVGECSLGSILVARSARGVCAIYLGDDPETLLHEMEDRFPNATLIGGDKDFDSLVAKVVGFVEEPKTGLDLPLDVRGTAFQQRVWRALQQIPAGKTVSYTELAKQIGAPKSVRAVANACGAKRDRGRHPLSPRGAQGRDRVGLSLGRRTQARALETRESRVNAEPKIAAADAEERLARIDWDSVAAELNSVGAAVLERLLTPKECREITAL